MLDGQNFSFSIDQFNCGFNSEWDADFSFGLGTDADLDSKSEDSSLSDGHGCSKSNDHNSSDCDSELNDLFIRSSNADHKRDADLAAEFFTTRK